MSLGRSQAFHGIPELPTNWGESFSEDGSGLKAEQLQSHFQAVPGTPLLQGGSVPTETSSTMAFISSDPHSHPHNGKKKRFFFNYSACTVLWLHLDAQNEHIWKKINEQNRVLCELSCITGQQFPVRTATTHFILTSVFSQKAARKKGSVPAPVCMEKDIIFKKNKSD